MTLVHYVVQTARLKYRKYTQVQPNHQLRTLPEQSSSAPQKIKFVIIIRLKFVLPSKIDEIYFNSISRYFLIEEGLETLFLIKLLEDCLNT